MLVDSMVTKIKAIVKKSRRFIRHTAKLPRLKLASFRFNKNLHKFQKPYSLHLGCGHNRFVDWVNLDAD